MEQQDNAQEMVWHEPLVWLEEADGRDILSATDETAHTCLFTHWNVPS